MDTEPYPGEQERWQGHPGDRALVTDLINAEGLDNVIFITGDIHMNYLGHADETDPSVAGRMWEVCSTMGNINPLVARLKPEQFDWTARDPHQALLTFDPTAGTVHVAFHAEDGSLSYERTLTLGA
jgi:phosphodiesterase/alkaline phosphatase D-like protein